jgi:outer membrane lipoprotein-sorting protein
MRPFVIAQDASFLTKFSYNDNLLRCCRLRSLAIFFLITAGITLAQPSPDLQRVLTALDHAAANFHSTQANFVWTQYTKLVDESDVQKGTVYYRRTGNQVEMAADVKEPVPPKYVLFTGNKVQVYQTKIDQVNEYDVGKNRAAFESFLVLGFGGSGEDMLKSFDVTYAGTENIDGVNTEKLDLVPKSEKVKNTFTHIVLWIDPTRGISVKQQFFAPGGDYRLANYSDIRLNEKVPDSAFKLKTTGKTKFLSPNG